MGFAIDGRFRLVGDEKRQTRFEINAGDVVGQVGGRQRWFGVGQFRRGKRGGDLGLGMGRWGRQSSDLVRRSLGSLGLGGIFGGGGPVFWMLVWLTFLFLFFLLLRRLFVCVGRQHIRCVGHEKRG